MILNLPLNSTWKPYLSSEFKSDYFHKLDNFLEKEVAHGKIIYPKKENIFNALNSTDFDKVKVVIIGQDPYHGENQAHGLSFSVNKGVKIPPSLVNIYKELESDLGLKMPKSGYLQEWAEEGVLLLNNVLTVEASKAASHHKKGWEIFTDKIIDALNENREHLVFILWGAPAQKKAARVDRKKHLVIESVHPSPLSAYRGFFGSKPFSQANHYLTKHGIKPINWQITP